MEIKLPRHTKKTKIAKERWLRIATDAQAHMLKYGYVDVPELADKYGYTRQHVYVILRKLRNEPIN